jgi:hypothetical protein
MALPEGNRPPVLPAIAESQALDQENSGDQLDGDPEEELEEDDEFAVPPEVATQTTVTSSAHQPEPQQPAPQAEPQQAPMNNGIKRPYTPDILKEKLVAKIDQYTKARVVPSEMTRKMIVPNLEICFNGSSNETIKDKRRTVQKWLFGVNSSKDLTDAQILACRDWLNAKPDSGGEWKPEGISVTEANDVYTRALLDKGQMELSL